MRQTLLSSPRLSSTLHTDMTTNTDDNTQPHGMDQARVVHAFEAAEVEKAMPFRQAVSTFWRGGLFSMVLSLALVMEGYDTGLVSQTMSRCSVVGIGADKVQLKSFYGQPEFLKKFGSLDPTGKLYIPANWQAALSNAVSAGEVLGLLVCDLHQ
jgi:SP family general alpha glucoside:H+ symporter-like MFS transporter